MVTFLSIVVLGFFLGMRHATDPDHVIAVTTIVSRHRSIRHAAAIGALWGVGHTLTILLVGGGIILFGWVIPARLGLSMELSVGLMLILLGTLNLTGILELITNNFTPTHDRYGVNRDYGPGHATTQHLHGYPHGDCVYTHTHTHHHELYRHDVARTPLNWFDRHFGRLGLYNAIRPLAVGLIHGLAGSAAVALLVLSTIHDPKWSAAYLLLFGVGTIAGMMLITGVMGAPFVYAENRSRLSGGLRVASGLISLTFGIFIVYQIIFVSGLLTAYPEWTPR